MATLSENAARALEQVKMGLYMLYGAAYFTEEEWIKIDLLINKGKYVWTSGPAKIITGQELISFDDTNEKSNFETHTNGIEILHTIKEEGITISEKQIHSPSSSEPEETTDYLTETPNETSVEASSDDEPAIQKPAKSSSVLDLQAMEEVSELNSSDNLKREHVQLPAEGGLALGYTQAQLDEIKAFNSGLTKAGTKSGKKGKSGHESIEDSYQLTRPISPPSFPTEDVTYSSPTPTERDTRVQSWASEIEEDAPIVTEIVGPTPSKVLGADTSLQEHGLGLIKEFEKVHGKHPKAPNDIIQPNNPQFLPLPARSISRASNKTVKGSSKPSLNVPPGTVLIAQGPATGTGGIRMEVRTGDRIKVFKHVSGEMHLGQNLRTSAKGQFPESIFKRKSTAALPRQDWQGQELVVERQRMLAQAASNKPLQSTIGHSRFSSVSSVGSNGLDRFEGMNAAEWDDVPVISRPRTAAPQSIAPVRKPATGLGASRFAVLADDCKSESSADDPQQVVQTVTRDEMSRLVDEKIAQLLAAQSSTVIKKPIPTGPANLSLNNKMKEERPPFTPKTYTCWFWHRNVDGCRFREEECANLHSVVPGKTEEGMYYLINGKPSWGAFVDYQPGGNSYQQPKATELSLTTTSASQFYSSNQVSGMRGVDKSTKSLFTCWYWGTTNRCNNTAEDCMYLHEHVSAGLAKRPNNYRERKWHGAWRDGKGFGTAGSSWGEEMEAGEEDELVLEMVNEDDDGWGSGDTWRNTHVERTWGNETSLAGETDDKYKPPHIKALEQQATESSW